MKIVLQENQTIPVNPDLLQSITFVYRTYYEAFRSILGGEVNPRKSDAYNEIQKLGGKAYLKNLLTDNTIHFIWQNYPLSKVMDYDNDSVLKRRLKLKSDEEFQKFLTKYPDSVISLAFWVHDPNNASDETLGEFEKNYETDDGKRLNTILIRFPSTGPLLASNQSWPQLKTTIRHELQHFTQYFYSRLFGLNKWIGLPKKNLAKGQNQFTDNPFSNRHEDIPVEIATDVQDEIDDFIRDAKLMNLDELKPAILNYIGIGSGKYIDSEVFKHYLETNKEIWRWSVVKLLTAVSKLQG